jgi:hypothetical protein
MKYKFSASHRRNISKARIGKKASKKTRRLLSRYHTRRYRNPLERQLQSRIAKEIWSRPAYQKKIRKSRKASWKDLEKRKNLLRGLKANRKLSCTQKKPSKVCKKIYYFLKSYATGLKLEYRISRLHVDIALPRLKRAIEIDGWAHRYFPSVKLRDENRDKFLASKGWKVLRLKISKGSLNV